MNFDERTPVVNVDGIWLKRDDLFELLGLRGGKVRTCAALARSATDGLITASARMSPQAEIVAAFAKSLALPCRVHTAWGGMTPELNAATRLDAEIVSHRPGYNSVIRRRASDDALARGWTEIPFGMESRASTDLTKLQVQNLPKCANRLIVPVGSGMSLAGILHGLLESEIRLPVLGVMVGANPHRRLDRWAPAGWRDLVELVRCDAPYHHALTGVAVGGIALDPIYEAKCLAHCKRNDCLWIVGHR